VSFRIVYISMKKTYFDIDLPDSTGLFFVSDTHFGHKKLVTSCEDHFDNCRTYATVEEMEADIRKKWNAAVGDGDTVVFLGDFIFGNYEGKGEEVAKAILDSLPGNKLFIRGNHDQKIKGELIDVRDYAIICWRGLTYLCQHVPFAVDVDADPSVLNNYKAVFDPKATVLVHGHTHSTDRFSRTNRKDFSLQNCVCWEAYYDMVPAERLYPANRTYVGKCAGHPVVAEFRKECTDEH